MTPQQIEEFREYFDRCLKPKKPTMKNLDREICINFITTLLEKQREEYVEMIESKMDNMGEAGGYNQYLAGLQTAINIIKSHDKTS